MIPVVKESLEILVQIILVFVQESSDGISASQITQNRFKTKHWIELWLNYSTCCYSGEQSRGRFMATFVDILKSDGLERGRDQRTRRANPGGFGEVLVCGRPSSKIKVDPCVFGFKAPAKQSLFVVQNVG